MFGLFESSELSRERIMVVINKLPALTLYIKLVQNLISKFFEEDLHRIIINKVKQR